ncbi:Nif11-like leader peptide family RiPP precursor [Desulfovibrio sp. JC010]|uniref:Nif11-like leader peptide family RiPP precursor n=1 Tax=Desulfovibrio sp. JC010 TaxID=2593641 RepID=UPI0013D0481D|nr:Nif11-like leader peptide family RiPP precursor [Desulfovibrio sp. JC010]NDV27678.1 Nif11-like leader peptide family natural product precursor [Desulfovibrio sp. JC010]
MSQENAKAWILKVQKDEELKCKIETIQEFEALPKVAREHGFEFSLEEFKSAAAECMGELSDEDLDSVSGGKQPEIMWQAAHVQGINALMNTGESVGDD